MATAFKFNISNSWSLESAQESKRNGGALKTHQVFLEDGKKLEVSAAKSFKGDATKYNPEELLMAALSSCHFMSYIYVCEQADISILKYEDNVDGFLKLNDDGSGAFTKITLNPKVTIETKAQVELAKQLHAKAGRLCFIANSCSFDIEYKPEILVV